MPCGADIVDICPGKRGPCSDIKIWRSRQHLFAEEEKFAGDKAYIGEPQINTFHKKPKKQELSSEQKEENKQFYSTRIFVKNIIKKLEIFRVICSKNCLKLKMYDSVFKVVYKVVRLDFETLILEVLNQGDDDEEIAIKLDHLWSSFLTVNP